MTTHWTPLACLLGSTKSECDFQASIKAFTDGGANQVHRIVGDNLENYLPDYISGDFDSICPDVMNFYKAKGVQVIPTPDQNETDLTKCLRILLGKQDMVEFDQIVILNAFGKRLDQTMANIESLFHVAKLTSKPVYLMSEDSMACLLLPGKHVIHVNTGLEDDWCGLIPIGAESDGQLAFGSLVSTSNTYVEGGLAVTVENDTPILWAMGIRN
ncbi:thiamine pyrophosphokinase 1 [Acropora cervicornis]|uniref:Thiamine pyrophosphokinase 1 n=1 Tax=Acropora cervicornis TaxID=6130 RepID=A0AAD9QZ74_ACRCE|nr:thiamine pyrophosphokinase 1 [Acropora cervicornis]